MSQAVFIIIYLVFSILVGFCGSPRRIGFFGTFILSILLTPVVVLLVLILVGPSRRVQGN
jgi:hypothetical protein